MTYVWIRSGKTGKKWRLGRFPNVCESGLALAEGIRGRCISGG